MERELLCPTVINVHNLVSSEESFSCLTAYILLVFLNCNYVKEYIGFTLGGHWIGGDRSNVDNWEEWVHVPCLLVLFHIE